MLRPNDEKIYPEKYYGRVDAIRKELKEHMIRMVVSDIDGTLLTEGTGWMEPEYYEVIRRLKQKGILFVAASGRQYASMKHVFAPVADDIIFVSENGTNIIKNDKDLINIYMDQEMAKEVIEYIRTLPECDVMLCTPRTQYLEKRNEALLDWLTNGYHSHVEVVDDLLDYTHIANKISLYRADGAAAVGEEILERFASRLNIAVSGSVWIDFTNPDMDKGTTISQLQQQMGITPQETIVFGDNCNDLGMFRCAQETYAVETAHPELLEAAKHIIPSPDDNGVLQVLKSLLV